MNQDSYTYDFTIAGNRQRGTISHKRAGQLRCTRAYHRYGKILRDINPSSKIKAVKLLSAAFDLVEEYSGHKSETNAIGSWDAICLIIAELEEAEP